MTAYFDQDLFVKKLKGFRGERKQYEVAKLLDISRPTLSNLENGKQIPNLDLLLKICDKLNIKPNDLFYQEEQSPVVMMMGQLKAGDKQNFSKVMDRIAIRQKYYAMAKRCGSR